MTVVWGWFDAVKTNGRRPNLNLLGQNNVDTTKTNHYNHRLQQTTLRLQRQYNN